MHAHYLFFFVSVSVRCNEYPITEYCLAMMNVMTVALCFIFVSAISEQDAWLGLWFFAKVVSILLCAIVSLSLAQCCLILNNISSQLWVFRLTMCSTVYVCATDKWTVPM